MGIFASIRRALMAKQAAEGSTVSVADKAQELAQVSPTPVNSDSARIDVAKNPPRVDLAQFSQDDMKAVERLTGSAGQAGYFSTDGLTVQQRINAANLQGGATKGADTQPGVPMSTFNIGAGGYQITPEVQAYLDQFHTWQKSLQDAKDAELAAHQAAGTLTKDEQHQVNKQQKKSLLRSLMAKLGM